MDIDATLDTLVLQVAKHLIDDYPANDPRWTNHRDLGKKVIYLVFACIIVPPKLGFKKFQLELFSLQLLHSMQY